MSGEKQKVLDEAIRRVTQQLTDEGKLIEVGFVIFEQYVIPKDASQLQREEMRLAFMAGAEHLFNSILGILDPSDEPTEADIRRMDSINEEIQQWRARIALRVEQAKGRA